MWLIRLIRYIRGYVEFSARGVFSERFLNLLINNRFNLWNARKQGDTLYGFTLAKNYPQLYPYAKKTGVKLRVIKKYGFPFRMRTMKKKRKGQLAGILAFAAVIVTLSLFVWKVDVRGNERLSTPQILDKLEELGVKPGALRFPINARDVEEKMMLTFDDLSWIAVNLRGSTATIEIKERVMPPEKIKSSEPCNIVAAKAGQIQYMEVYQGQTLIQLGDTVNKGEIIVSGVVEDKTEHTYYRQARAKILAKTSEQFSISIPLSTTVTQKDLKQKQQFHSWKIFGKDFSFTGKTAPYPLLCEDCSPVKIGDVSLPIFTITRETAPQTQQLIQQTPEQAKRLALNRLQQIEWGIQNNGGEVLEKKLHGEVKEGTYVLTVQLSCREDIALAQPILIEQSSN